MFVCIPSPELVGCTPYLKMCSINECLTVSLCLLLHFELQSFIKYLYTTEHCKCIFSTFVECIFYSHLNMYPMLLVIYLCCILLTAVIMNLI